MAMTPNVIAEDSPGNFIGTPGGENLYSAPSVALQKGESRMTPAPWQLPSGGATTPQAAFQNDFTTAQDFRDRAISQGADPKEADAIYLAPVKAKWKTISAAPELMTNPVAFLKFNSEFSKATDNYNSQIKDGGDPKSAAENSIAPVLAKWTLKPTQTLADSRLSDAIKIASSPDGILKEALDKLGPKVSYQEANTVRNLFREAHPTPKTSTGSALDQLIGSALGNNSAPLKPAGAAANPTNGVRVRNKKTGQTGIQLPDGTIIPDK